MRVFIRLTMVAAGVAAAAKGADLASAGETRRVPEAATPRELRQIVDHYRSLTTTYQRIAHRRQTTSAATYRRSASRAYLQWTIDLWHSRAERARAEALAAVQTRAGVTLPQAPHPGHATAGSDTFRTTRSADYRRWVLHLWQRRAADAALAVSTHGSKRLATAPLTAAFMCIHRYEGPWTANTGNGFYGGLQMDWSFMRRHGADFLAWWGTADRWPVWAQIEAAARAHWSGRGFSPWPNTARYCAFA